MRSVIKTLGTKLTAREVPCGDDGKIGTERFRIKLNTSAAYRKSHRSFREQGRDSATSINEPPTPFEIQKPIYQ